MWFQRFRSARPTTRWRGSPASALAAPASSLATDRGLSPASALAAPASALAATATTLPTGNGLSDGMVRIRGRHVGWGAQGAAPTSTLPASTARLASSDGRHCGGSGRVLRALRGCHLRRCPIVH